MYLMLQSWYTVVVKSLGAATQFPAFFLVQLLFQVSLV